MKEFGPMNHLPGDGYTFYDRHERLTSQPYRSYASDMATEPSTPERKWDPIDELGKNAPPLHQSPSENLRQIIDVVYDSKRQNAEAQYGRELTPLEQAEIRNQVMSELGLLGTGDSAEETPEFVSTGHPQLDRYEQMMRMNNPEGGTGDAKAQKQAQKERSETEKTFRQPRSLNELMESIAEYEPEFAHDFPLLYTEEFVNEEGNLEKRELVNEANFLRWIRKRMRFFEGEDGPDSKVNYFGRLGIPFGAREIHISHMLNDEEKYFKDASGAVHKDLADQIRRELFARIIVRDRDIDYRTGGNGMSDEGGIDAVLRGIFRTNNMTRNTWNGKSMWHWLLEMPHDVKVERVEKGHGHTFYERHDKQDTRLGRGIATAIAAYYHLADYTKLQEMIGKDSAFFKKEEFLRLRQSLAEGESKSNPYSGEETELAKKYISDKEINEIFKSDGKVDEAAFIKFVNFFPDANVDPRRLSMVRGLLRNAIGHKYKLYYEDHKTHEKVIDEESVQFAEEYAFFTTRWTGIATRNDLGGTAYDAQAKWLRFKNYREKVADASRGGMFGNMYNAGMFKTLGVNYLDSIRTQDGRLVREIIEDLARVKTADVDLSKDSLTEEEIKELDEENSKSRQLLSEFTFPDLSELNLYNNGIMRWVQEYKSFIGAEELHLDKLVEQARFGGVLYDPAAFGKQIQEGFLKPLRYGYSSWPNLYSKTVRDIVEYDENIHKGLPTVKVNGKDNVFVDMSLAESMFGHELMDREQFWTRLPRYENGKEITDKDGNPTGKVLEHIVDPRLIDTSDGRTQMFKQMALGRIAADIYSHIDLNSPYPKWDGATITALINALEVIPGALLVDEHDIKNTLVPQFFFTRDDIKWLRSIAHVSETRRNTIDVTRDSVKAGWSVGRKFLQAFIKGIK